MAEKKPLLVYAAAYETIDRANAEKLFPRLA